MDFFRDVFRGCGMLWTLALFVSFSFALVWGVAALGFSRKRAYPSVVLGVSLLPLVVGTLGSVEAYVQVMRVIDASTVQPTPSMLAHGMRMVMMTTWVGGAGSALLLPLAVIGLVFRRRTTGEAHA